MNTVNPNEQLNEKLCQHAWESFQKNQKITLCHAS